MAASTELTISPSTTRVGWIGTSVMGQSMCGHLLKAGYTFTVFNPMLSKAQPLIHLGAHLADSTRVVVSQSAVIFSIVGYPSDVRSIVLDPTTDVIFDLCPGGVLVDMTTKNCSLINVLFTGGGDLNIPIYPGPLFNYLPIYPGLVFGANKVSERDLNPIDLAF